MLLYMDVLVEITLQFIMASDSNDKLYYGGSDSQNSNQQEDNSQTLTVNASACEFMELILKQVEKYSSFSNKISHIIIEPLIDTFYNVILKKNYAMQVNIINLLDLIFKEGNFQGAKIDAFSYKEQQEDSKLKCIMIFKNSKLIDCIIMGLKSEVSFVRQKFIKFVEMYIPYLRKFTKENDKFKDDFRLHVMRLIDCFCELLKKVDVQFFSKSKKIGNQGQSIQKRQSAV